MGAPVILAEEGHCVHVVAYEEVALGVLTEAGFLQTLDFLVALTLEGILGILILKKRFESLKKGRKLEILTEESPLMFPPDYQSSEIQTLLVLTEEGIVAVLTEEGFAVVLNKEDILETVAEGVYSEFQADQEILEDFSCAGNEKTAPDPLIGEEIHVTQNEEGDFQFEVLDKEEEEGCSEVLNEEEISEVLKEGHSEIQNEKVTCEILS
jgi:hypothetical protein